MANYPEPRDIAGWRARYILLPERVQAAIDAYGPICHPEYQEAIAWAVIAATEATPPDAGVSTCPVCGRRWLVTPADDCMLPACGFYGYDASAANPARPCFDCGLKHAWTCPRKTHYGQEL